ncbi:hypothetical protein [Actinoallomurus iriomotensis]|uniref:hypothetical protein n=1 Tax=Actinoallomurus iriomotensis TaxID=478107 RepID=UPI00255358AB|nr:hypothetical protein [Actinoallomurus iriomotensis]
MRNGPRWKVGCGAALLDMTGTPASVVPLVWTGAITVPALSALDGDRAPVPPA